MVPHRFLLFFCSKMKCLKGICYVDTSLRCRNSVTNVNTGVGQGLFGKGCCRHENGLGDGLFDRGEEEEVVCRYHHTFRHMSGLNCRLPGILV